MSNSGTQLVYLVNCFDLYPSLVQPKGFGICLVWDMNSRILVTNCLFFIFSQIPGFRPGKKVPESILISHVGKQAVQKATIESILKRTLPHAMSLVCCPWYFTVFCLDVKSWISMKSNTIWICPSEFHLWVFLDFYEELLDMLQAEKRWVSVMLRSNKYKVCFW